MTYYPDLSEYSYYEHDQPMVNVGWLGRGHDFVKGDVDRQTLATILTLADLQQNVMRGVHDCEFCDIESPQRIPAPVEKGYVSLGMGEIRVESVKGVVYSAPSLIYHYIRDHRYLPPEEFLEGVRTAETRTR